MRRWLVALGAAALALAGAGPAGAVTTAPGGLTVVPSVDGLDCGQGFYVFGSSVVEVRSLFGQRPEPGRPVVVQQQLVDLDEPAQSQDTGVVPAAAVGAPQWYPSIEQGHRYRLRSRAAYGTTERHQPWGVWSGTTNLLVPPPRPAPVTVSSLDYPTGYLDGAPAGLGSLTVTMPPGVHAFAYSWDSSSVPSVSRCDVAQDGSYVRQAFGQYRLPVPASLGSGPHTLYVASVDVASQKSDVTQYGFSVAPDLPGATPGSDRHEGERARVRTSALTYTHPVPGSSGGSERVVVATGAGQSVTMPLTVPVDGYYALQLAGTRTDHSGTVNVAVDGVLQPDPYTGEVLAVDLYSATPTHVERFVARALLTAGTHTITLVTTSPNVSSRDVVDHGVHDHGSSIAIDFARATWEERT